MARTVNQIYEAMIAEKEQYTELQVLNSTSKVAVWRLIFYIVAVIIWVHETLWDEAKIEIETIRQAAKIHTAEWLAQEALNFQLGDNLERINNVFQYPEINPEKQIIKYASVLSARGITFLKVYKQEDKLTNEEYDAFSYYINYFKAVPGQYIQIISESPDSVKINATVYYNPIYTQTSISNKVNEAINLYFSNLPFNGQIKLSSLTDAIQSVNGVDDIVIESAYGKTDVSEYQIINRIYQSISGRTLYDSNNSIINYTNV